MEAIVELKSVNKSFGEKTVLHGIDLAIPKGRVVGLLGKNGAGKTTLIKCVLGLLKVDDGEARIFGEDSRRLSGLAKARIGYVPQRIDLYPWMKVRHMIRYIAAFYSNWNDALAASLLRIWELNEEDRVGGLSEGQTQRLGLILALGHQPDLLILDEPAASLDPGARRAFLATIIDVATDQNRTVVLSTHLTSDLERVASDIVLLKSGKVHYFGTMDDLKDSVKSLTLTSGRRLPATLNLPGVLSFEARNNHALLTMQGVDDELIHRLEAAYDASVEVRDLTLEDIFVEVHRG